MSDAGKGNDSCDPFDDDDLLDNAHGVTASETLHALEWRSHHGTLTNADRKDAEMLLARAASAHTLDQEDTYVTAAALIIFAGRAGAAAWYMIDSQSRSQTSGDNATRV
jgi:hypothetical protein